jgi:hypothetical protein
MYTIEQIESKVRSTGLAGGLVANNPRNKEFEFYINKPTPFVQGRHGAVRMGSNTFIGISVVLDSKEQTITWSYDSQACATNANATGKHKILVALLGTTAT